MPKQTAVEWLEKICNDRGYHLMSEYFNQAKAMEKEQIVDAYQKGYLDLIYKPNAHYNETYKGGQDGC